VKFLLLLILIGLIIYLSGARKGGGSSASGSGQNSGQGAGQDATQVMVSCAQCGLHVPQSEAYPGRGGQFCCAAHRSAYEARHNGAA